MSAATYTPTEEQIELAAEKLAVGWATPVDLRVARRVLEAVGPKIAAEVKAERDEARSKIDRVRALAVDWTCFPDARMTGESASRQVRRALGEDVDA